MAKAVTVEGGVGRGCRLYRLGDEWHCSISLQSDIIIEVEGILFHLHKFPLISKCGMLARMVKGSQGTKDEVYHISLEGCPGGPDAFFIATRFCYESKVELNPKNILLVYSAADFLEMTEEYSEDNLLMKAESFIHNVILRSWKDCISALQSSRNCPLEDVNSQIVHKLLKALSTMACSDPSLPANMYGSLQSPGGSILWNGINTGARIRSTSDWWFKDVSSLSVPMFKKFIKIINICGIRSEDIAGALMFYAMKHLPGLDRWQNMQGGRSMSMNPAVGDQKILIKNIVELLPENKGKSYCRFLLGLLRLAIILDVDWTCKELLERKIGMQLELVTLDGLLVPSFSGSDNLYDTDCVERIIQHFLSFQSASASDHALPPSSRPLNMVTKLIDDYLFEVAPDVYLKPQKMQSLMEVFPESLRTLDDGIYRALDMYFKEHPWLQDNDRVQLFRTINCRKLTTDACVHASRNQRLPLRVVLQVLFFGQQQLRTALSDFLHNLHNGNNVATNTNENAREDLHRESCASVARDNQNLRIDMERMRSKVRELEHNFESMKSDIGRFSRG